MLLYGFVYERGESFTAPSLMAVTDIGYTLVREGNNVTATRDEQWRLSRPGQTELAEVVDAAHAARTGSGDQTSKIRLISIPDGMSDWAAVAGRFADEVTAVAGAVGTPGEFVRRCLPAVVAAGLAPIPPVTLPSGGQYRPRLINGIADIEVLRAANRAHLPVSLEGPPGTGKGSAAYAAHGHDLVVLHCYEGMLREDMVGALLPVPGQVGDFGWIDGPLLQAMSEGRPLLIDEAGWMPPGLQALLHTAMDDSRTVTILDRPGETIIGAAPGFSVITTVNPGLGFGLTEPVRNRLALTVTVPADLDIAADLGVPPPLLALARQRHSRAIRSGDHHLWVPSIRELVTSSRTESVFGLQFAASALAAQCPDEQREQFVEEAALLLAEAPTALTALAP